MRKLVGIGLAVALTMFLAFGTALADGMPSSKVTVALGELKALRKASTDTESGSTDDTGFVTVLQNFIKMPNQKDLSIDVALQCSLVTDTTVKSQGGNKDVSQADGGISVRVKVTDLDTGEVSYAGPSEDGLAPDGGPLGVTYCSRLQRLEAKFAGLNCFAAPYGVEGYCDEGMCTAGNVGDTCTTNADCDVVGGDPNGVCTDGICTAGRLGAECEIDDDCDLAEGEVWCEDPEELRLLLETLNANAFNFFLGDVSPGIKQIEVQARAQAGADLFGTELGEAAAEAFVGLGSMRVENCRLIKDAGTGPIVELQ